MQENITLRQYKPSDLSHVVPMFRAGMVGNFFSYFATKGLNVQKEEELPPPVIEYLDNSVKTDLANIEEVYINKGGNFWVAVVNQGADEKIVGMVALERIDADTAELRRMSVHKDFRKQGVGRILLQGLEDYAREKNFKKVFLSTLDIFAPAVAMYKANGYPMIIISSSAPFAFISTSTC